MNVVTVYNYPPSKFGPEHQNYAQRFVDSYLKHPPLHDHKMVVISNGGPPSGRAVAQFTWIKGTRIIHRLENAGMDIAAYQLAATIVCCDLMVFFGGSSYIRGPGWLLRMVNAYETYGDGLYGCTGNQGDSRLVNGGQIERIWPHVRTTGFWCNPRLINDHPLRVTENSQRYPYEHGAGGLTTWTLSQKKPVMIVGWNDVRALHECDSMPGGFHQGNQENIIVGDRLCAPPYHHCP